MNASIVPTFSLPELREDSPCHEEFRRCLEDIGAFYLTDYGIPDTEHDAVAYAAMDFFNNANDKERLLVTNTNPETRRGYSGLEMESTAQTTNTGVYSDYSMAYSVGLSDNLFPQPNFERAFMVYFNSAYRLTQEVGRAVLMAAGIERPEGLKSFLECDPLLRFRHFPDVPKERCSEHEPSRMAPHYDISVVTLIQQTACANGFVSLQCETKDGFVKLPHKPNTVIILCGAVSTLLSHGKVKAPKHQVTAPPENNDIGSGRTSCVLFLRPKSNFEFSVSQAKACGLDVIVSGETATFKDWIGRNYVKMRTDECFST